MLGFFFRRTKASCAKCSGMHTLYAGLASVREEIQTPHEESDVRYGSCAMA